MTDLTGFDFVMSSGTSGAELDGFGYYGLVDSQRNLSDPSHPIDELTSDELEQWGKTLIDAADELCTPVGLPTPPYACSQTRELPISSTVMISSSLANGNSCVSALVTVAVLLLARRHKNRNDDDMATDPLLSDDSLQVLRTKTPSATAAQDANLHLRSSLSSNENRQAGILPISHQ
jgi:hypothetical protein